MSSLRLPNPRCPGFPGSCRKSPFYCWRVPRLFGLAGAGPSNLGRTLAAPTQFCSNSTIRDGVNSPQTSSSSGLILAGEQSAPSPLRLQSSLDIAWGREGSMPSGPSLSWSGCSEKSRSGSSSRSLPAVWPGWDLAGCSSHLHSSSPLLTHFPRQVV